MHKAKEIFNKVYNNIMNSTKLSYKMITVFKDYGNDKRSDPQIILFNLTNKINLTMSDKYVTLPNLSI